MGSTSRNQPQKLNPSPVPVELLPPHVDRSAESHPPHPSAKAPDRLLGSASGDQDRVGKTERRAVFILPLFAYLVLATLLVFHFESFFGDAQARVANAYYILFSRDPHFAAVGFVWNPLPSLSVLPLLPLTFIFPALTERAFAGNIVSALWMAGAVYQLHAILALLGLTRVQRLLLALLFSVHPMIGLYGSNGMSEALFLFSLLFATRSLMGWLEDGKLLSLAASGTAVAFAYLARHEAAAAALGAAILVFIVAGRRPSHPGRSRLPASIAATTAFLLPFTASFLGLAATSWAIVGSPFEQFSSVYGNATQVALLQANGSTVTDGSLRFASEQILALAPTLPLVAVLALLAVATRRRLCVLAPIAVLGGVLLFAVMASATGNVAGWTRYFITSVPLVVLLAAALLTPSSAGNRPAMRPSAGRRLQRLGLTILVAGLLVPGLPTTANAMLDPGVDPDDYIHLSHVFRSHDDISVAAQADADRFDQATAIAQHLDALGLPDTSILVDTFSPCSPFIVLASKRAKQFVITNDRDFQQVLNDPSTFGVQYFFVPPSEGYGALDALNRAYPSLYDTGADIATLEHEFGGASCPPYRLYRLDGNTS